MGVLVAALVACVPPPTVRRTPKAPAALPTSTPIPTATATAELLPTVTPVSLPTAQPQVEGPLAVNGQLLTALVIAPGSAVRYGTLGQGVVRSDDEGRQWRRVTGLPLPVPLVSPRDPRTLYAGDVPSCYKDDTAPLLMRSTDGGQGWKELAAGQGIRPVAIVPNAAGLLDTLYGISCPGLNVSADGGETWQLTGRTMGWDITGILPIEDGGLRFLAVLTSEGGSSHLAWFDGNGKLEQDLTQGLNFWGLGILARAGSTLYLADSMGVRRQSEASGQWELFTDGLADVVLETDPMTAGLSEEDAARGFGLFALAPDPLNPRRLALGTVRGLYLSQDGGEHWLPAGVEALARSRIERVAWDPAPPNTFYATTPGGVFVVCLPT